MAKVEILELQENINKTTEEVERLNDEIKSLKEQTQEVNKNFKDTPKNIEKIKKGISGIGLAIKAAGIGLLVSAFSAIKDTLGQQQGIADTFAITLGTITNLVSIISREVQAGAFSFANIAEYMDEAYRTAKQIVDLSNQARLNEAERLALVAENETKMEKLRQIRDDERRSIDDRIEANEKLGQLQEEALQRELQLARADVARADAQLRINNSVENQVQAWEALTRVYEIEARLVGQRSEQINNTWQLERDLAEATFELRKRGIEEWSQNEINVFRVVRKNAYDELEYEKQLLNERTELERQAWEDRLAATKEGSIERKRLSAEYYDWEKEQAQTRAEIEEKLFETNVDLAKGAAGAVASLSAENSNFQKAVAVAEATIDTYKGATKAWGQGGVFGAVGAAVVIAAGIANIRKILATEIPEPPGNEGGGGSYSFPSPPQPATSIGILDGALNPAQQISDQLGQLGVMKTYVLSEDVTNRQSMDRKIRENATFK